MKAFQKLALAMGFLILATAIVVIRARLSKPTAQPQLQREEPSPNLAARAQFLKRMLDLRASPSSSRRTIRLFALAIDRRIPDR